MQKNQTKKVAIFGMLIALAFILSYVESVISFHFVVPGIKLGLANLVVLLALYLLDAKSALVLSVIRVVLVSFTFGNLYSLWYSLAGAILSYIVMVVLKKSKAFSIVGVSVSGGVAHNMGQVMVAMYVLGRGMMYYFPFLMVGGIITGILIGILGGLVYKQIKRAVKMD
ncbi:Gx transporter family protein [Clostridium sp. Marseille-P299]|uniref:Gx transporter family protein n=1 Tax=Clostridium sp. Marseille-P299 TaxID=1805477 RepID=UPI000836653C|nr:Gx transporter family protein [Clostridium sp. Marseille-P299]